MKRYLLALISCLDRFLNENRLIVLGHFVVPLALIGVQGHITCALGADEIQVQIILTGFSASGTIDGEYKIMNATRYIGVNPFGSSWNRSAVPIESALSGNATITILAGGVLDSAQFSVGIVPECYANNYTVTIDGSAHDGNNFLEKPDLNSTYVEFSFSIKEKNPIFAWSGDKKTPRSTLPADGVSQARAHRPDGGSASISYSIVGPTHGANVDASTGTVTAGQGTGTLIVQAQSGSICVRKPLDLVDCHKQCANGNCSPVGSSSGSLSPVGGGGVNFRANLGWSVM